MIACFMLICSPKTKEYVESQATLALKQGTRHAKAFNIGKLFVLQMTGAEAKWAAALDTFDGLKHNFRAPGQVEKALNSIALDERVLLFNGSDSDIVERLSVYDQVEGECCLARACCVYH